MKMATDREKEKKEEMLAAWLKELHVEVGPLFNWHVEYWGGIRGVNTNLYDDPMCPVSAHAWKFTEDIYDTAHEAAAACGLQDVSIELVDAIENRNSSTLRAMILKALGIKDEK